MCDPATTTREQWTRWILSEAARCSNGADPRYKEACCNSSRLYGLLAAHECMAANLQQTMVTPAASKDKIYFTWDFVGRTLGKLLDIDPTFKGKASGVYTECLQRISFTIFVIHSRDKVDMLSQSTGNRPNDFESGREIKTAARTVIRKLNDLAEDRVGA